MCDNIEEAVGEVCPNCDLASIPGYVGYSASPNGHIINDKKGTVLQERDADGGRRVSIGKAAPMVHDLILRAWTGVPPKGYRPKHLNGDRSDNRLENLAWSRRTSGGSSKSAR